MVGSGANLATRADQVADADLRPGVTLLCQNEVDPAATFALLERAARRGARTILNLAPAAPLPAAVLDALDVLVVNQIEAAMAAQARSGADEPQALARDLAMRHALTCVVTLGGAGAIAHRRRRLADRRAGGRAGRHHGCGRRVRRRARGGARPRPEAARRPAPRERRGRPRLHPPRRPDQPAACGRDRSPPARPRPRDAARLIRAARPTARVRHGSSGCTATAARRRDRRPPPAGHPAPQDPGSTESEKWQHHASAGEGGEVVDQERVAAVLIVAAIIRCRDHHGSVRAPRPGERRLRGATAG